MAMDRGFIAIRNGRLSYSSLCFNSLLSDVAEGKTKVCGLNVSQHSPTVSCTGTNKNE